MHDLISFVVLNVMVGTHGRAEQHTGTSTFPLKVQSRPKDFPSERICYLPCG